MSGARRARAGEEGGPAVNRAARCPGLRRPETPPSAPPEPPGARPAAAPGLRPGAERLPLRARPAQSLQLSGPVPRVLRAQRAPPALRAPAASGERRAGRRMGCGLRVLRSARGRGSSGGRGSGRHRLPPGRPAPGILAQFSSAGGQLVAISPPSLPLIHLRPIFGYSVVVVLKWHRLNRSLCCASPWGQG